MKLPPAPIVHLVNFASLRQVVVQTAPEAHTRTAMARPRAHPATLEILPPLAAPPAPSVNPAATL